MYATIEKVTRHKDKKVFEVGDPAEVDGIFQGVIVGFNQFQDDFRVALDDGSYDDELPEDEIEGTYFSITELD